MLLAGDNALADGASILSDRFPILDWRDAFQELGASGPEGLIRKVRDHELSDTACERWPRGKTHDDATAVYCLTESGAHDTKGFGPVSRRNRVSCRSPRNVKSLVKRPGVPVAADGSVLSILKRVWSGLWSRGRTRLRF
jgi:hypothetical protein